MKLNYAYIAFLLLSLVAKSFSDSRQDAPNNSILQDQDGWTSISMGEGYSSYRDDILYPEKYILGRNYFYYLQNGMKYDTKLHLAMEEFRCRDEGPAPSATIVVIPGNFTKTWVCNVTDSSTTSLIGAEGFYIELTGVWGENARLLITVTNYYETNQICPDEFPFDCSSVPNRCNDPDSQIRKRQCIYGPYGPVCDKKRNCPESNHDEDKEYCDVRFCDDFGINMWYYVGPLIAIGVVSVVLIGILAIRRWRQKKEQEKFKNTTFVFAQPGQNYQNVVAVSGNIPQSQNYFPGSQNNLPQNQDNLPQSKSP